MSGTDAKTVAEVLKRETAVAEERARNTKVCDLCFGLLAATVLLNILLSLLSGRRPYEIQGDYLMVELYFRPAEGGSAAPGIALSQGRVAVDEGQPARPIDVGGGLQVAFWQRSKLPAGSWRLALKAPHPRVERIVAHTKRQSSEWKGDGVGDTSTLVSFETHD